MRTCVSLLYLNSRALQARAQMLRAVEDGTAAMRVVYLALEHSRMHLETLHYMRAQQAKHDFEAGLTAQQGEAAASCRLPENGVAASLMG